MSAKLMLECILENCEGFCKPVFYMKYVLEDIRREVLLAEYEKVFSGSCKSASNN